MKITIWFFLWLVPLTLTAQIKTATIDDRLYEVYDKTYLEGLSLKNPVLLRRWTYYLDHAWYITILPEGKKAKHYPLVIIEDLKKINILKLEKEQKLLRKWDEPSIYQINNSDKYLIYRPGKEFNEKMQSHFSVREH